MTMVATNNGKAAGDSFIDDGSPEALIRGPTPHALLAKSTSDGIRRWHLPHEDKPELTVCQVEHGRNLRGKLRPRIRAKVEENYELCSICDSGIPSNDGGSKDLVDTLDALDPDVIGGGG